LLIALQLSGSSDAGGFRNAWEGEDFTFHLEAGDVLAPAPDALLCAVLPVIVAVLISFEEVAGVEPALAPSLGVGGVIIIIAKRHRRPPLGSDDQFPALADRDVLAVLIDDPQIEAGPRRPATTGAHRRIKAL